MMGSRAAAVFALASRSCASSRIASGTLDAGGSSRCARRARMGLRCGLLCPRRADECVGGGRSLAYVTALGGALYLSAGMPRSLCS